MILLASISGIQDFLFDVREEGGGQARSLRHRSFRIQLIAECVAIRLLEAAGLSRDKLHFCAAAKVASDATGISTEALAAVRSTIVDLEYQLLHETHGRLRLACALEESCDTFASSVRSADRSCARMRRAEATICGAQVGKHGKDPTRETAERSATEVSFARRGWLCKGWSSRRIPASRPSRQCSRRPVHQTQFGWTNIASPGSQ